MCLSFFLVQLFSQRIRLVGSSSESNSDLISFTSRSNRREDLLLVRQTTANRFKLLSRPTSILVESCSE